MSAAIATGLFAAGCARAQPDVGSVRLALVLPDATTISQISYQVKSATSSILASGTIDSSDRTAEPSLSLSLPVGAGDTVTMTATTSAGVACSGTSPPFNVTANQSTQVALQLTCGGSSLATTGGSLIVNGSLTVGNNCPVLTTWAASPLQVSAPGGQINLTALATDADPGDVLTYTWSAASGTFAGPGPSSQYTCAAGGPQTLLLTVSDNHAPTPCTASVTIPVSCVSLATACPASVPGIWADLSGHGHDATLKNFGAGSGLVGDGTPANPYAMTFDGADDVAELAPGADGLRLTSEVTLEIWVNNFFAEGIGSYNSMYTNRVGAEYSGFFAGIINPGNINDSQWYAGSTVDGAGWSLLTTPGRPASNTWTHYVATFSVSQGLSRLYLNGVQVSSAPMTAPLLYSAGAVPRVGGEAAGDNFRGKLGEVRIWAAALDPSEVLARYQAGAPTYGIVAPSPTSTVTKPVALRLDAVCH